MLEILHIWMKLGTTVLTKIKLDRLLLALYKPANPRTLLPYPWVLEATKLARIKAWIGITCHFDCQTWQVEHLKEMLTERSRIIRIRCQM